MADETYTISVKVVVENDKSIKQLKSLIESIDEKNTIKNLNSNLSLLTSIVMVGSSQVNKLANEFNNLGTSNANVFMENFNKKVINLGTTTQETSTSIFSSIFKILGMYGKLVLLTQVLRDVTGAQSGNFLFDLNKNLTSFRETIYNTLTTIGKGSYLLGRDIVTNNFSITKSYQTVSSTFQQLTNNIMGVDFTSNVSNSVSKFAAKAAMLVGVIGGIIVAFKALSFAFDMVKKGFDIGFKAIQDYDLSIANLTATTNMFSKQNSELSLGQQFMQTKDVVENELMPTLIELGNATALTTKQAIQFAIEFAKGGQIIEANNKEQMDGLKNIAAAMSATFGAQLNEMQIRQEIGDLMDGTITANSTIGMQLKKIDPELKSHLKLWREQGTSIQNIGMLLKSYAPAAKSLENSWSVVSATLTSIIEDKLRKGVKPLYDIIVKSVQKLNYELLNNELYTQLINNTYQSIANTLSEIILPIIKQIWPTLELGLSILNVILKFINDVVVGVGIITDKFTGLGDVLLGQIPVFGHLITLSQILNKTSASPQLEEHINKLQQKAIINQTSTPTTLQQIKSTPTTTSDTSISPTFEKTTQSANQASAAITNISTASNQMQQTVAMNTNSATASLQNIATETNTSVTKIYEDLDKIKKRVKDDTEEAKKQQEFLLFTATGKTAEQLDTEEQALMRIESIKQNSLQNELNRIAEERNQRLNSIGLTEAEDVAYANRIINLQEQLTNFKIAESERNLTKLRETLPESINIEQIAADERTRINQEASKEILASIGDIPASLIQNLTASNQEVNKVFTNIYKNIDTTNKTLSESVQESTNQSVSSVIEIGNTVEQKYVRIGNTLTNVTQNISNSMSDTLEQGSDQAGVSVKELEINIAGVSSETRRVGDVAKESMDIVNDSVSGMADSASIASEQIAESSINAIEAVENASRRVKSLNESLNEAYSGTTDRMTAFVSSKMNELAYGHGGKYKGLPNSAVSLAVAEAKQKADALRMFLEEGRAETEDEVIRAAQQLSELAKMTFGHSGQKYSAGITALNSQALKNYLIEVQRKTDPFDDMLEEARQGLKNGGGGGYGKGEGIYNAEGGIGRPSMGTGSGGSGIGSKTTIYNINNNIQTPDVQGFSQSQDQIIEEQKRSISKAA